MKADLSFVHKPFVCVWSFVCGVRIFVCGFFGADFSVRIFVRIFVRICFCTETAGRATKKIQQKIHQKSSPNSSPNFLSKNPPKNPSRIPLRTFASRSSLGLKGGAGAHPDALVEVGCQSRRLSGNRWQGLTQG